MLNPASIALLLALVPAPSTSCDVRGVFREVDLPMGAMVQTGVGDLEEAQVLLVPANVESGAYDLTVTRKATNTYKVVGSNLYVITRYCFEFGFSQKATLRYQSAGTYGAGTLTFER